MTPFATWSKARHADNDTSWDDATQQFGSRGPSEAEIELTGLMDSIVENLMTASVAQLRGALETVGMRWANQQMSRQETSLKREMAKVEENIMSAVADTLLPVLTELQLREVMKEFAVTLQKLLPEFGAQNLLIKAPEDIHAMLNEALQRQAIVADIVGSETQDVTIASHQVVLAADLSAWSQRLREIVVQ